MNNLNVLSYGYSGRGVFRKIKQFFRNIKYAYQRITRGYCDQDIWNLDAYYAELFYQTLNKLADNTISYPGRDMFIGEEGYERWKSFLREMAEHFRNTQEYDDIPLVQKANKLSEEMHSYIVDSECVENEDGTYGLNNKYSDEEAYNKAFKNWLEADQDVYKFREAEKNKAFDMMKNCFFGLWD